MSEVPEDRCGFEMLAGDVSGSEIRDADSLSEAVESNRAAVCCRGAAEGSEQCIWHADGIKKSGSGHPCMSDSELPRIGGDVPVVLDGAKLPGLFLREQEFYNTQMRFTDLSGATFQLAHLSGIDLRGADLSEASFYGTEISGVDFSDTNLSGAEFSGVDFSEVDFCHTSLQKAEISHCNLSEAELHATDLSKATLRGAGLSGAVLQGLDLSGADISAEDISDAEINDVNLSNANIEHTDLSNTDLEGSDLSNADLEGADLSKSNLEGSDLSNVDLEGTDLSKSNLFDANLTGAELYGAILSDIRLNDATKFGDHYTDEDDSIEKATWTLRQIEQISRESALPEQVTEAVVERKTRRRKDHWKEGNYLSWLRNAGFGLLTKYGESPGQVVILSLLTILGGIVTFPIFGIRDTTTSNNEILTYALQNTTLPNLLGKSLYLSTVTFTTVGYGDLQPVGLGQLVATVESFLGALLMALLVFVLGRRATR